MLLEGYFKSGILPSYCWRSLFGSKNKNKKKLCGGYGWGACVQIHRWKGLSKLKPAFAAGGCVTGQFRLKPAMGLRLLWWWAERMIKWTGIKTRLPVWWMWPAPVCIHALWESGPVEAVPKVLKQAGMNLSQIDLIELNGAFASQSLAVISGAEFKSWYCKY